MIPDSVTNICGGFVIDSDVDVDDEDVTCKGAFEDCSGLTSIIIPDSVICIEAAAFRGCTGLISVVIPDSVTEMSGYTFVGCTQLEQVIAPARFHHLFPSVASLTEPSQSFVLK